jgi:hypothetical protein
MSIASRRRWNLVNVIDGRIAGEMHCRTSGVNGCGTVTPCEPQGIY